MDELQSVMLFCGDNDMYAEQTCLQCEAMEESVVMVTINPARYPNARIFFSMSGEWNLRSLYSTHRAWLGIVTVLRGDVAYSDSTLQMLFAHASYTQANFYYENGELICFNAPLRMLKSAISDMMAEEYIDENDWYRLKRTMWALNEGRVSACAVTGNIIASAEVSE
jgi:hypothetical protein